MERDIVLVNRWPPLFIDVDCPIGRLSVRHIEADTALGCDMLRAW
jgi:hypothetical protein